MTAQIVIISILLWAARAVAQEKTRNSATTDAPRDELCQSKSCLL